MKFSSFFCDDIRHESDGRRSFIGVYPTSTVVSKFPHIYPKLCLFVEVELRSGDDFSKAEIVIFDDDHELGRLPVSDADPVPAGKGRYNGYEVTMSPVVVQKPETVRAKLEIGGSTHPLRHLRFRAEGEVLPKVDKVALKKPEPARKSAKKSTVRRKREA